MSAFLLGSEPEGFLQKVAGVIPGWLYGFVQRSDDSIAFTYISSQIEVVHEVSATAVLADAEILLRQIHPDDWLHYRQTLAYSRATLEPLFLEWRIITPSGKLKYLRTNSQPERLPNQDTFWYGMVLDITAEKQSQEELIQLNNDLQESEQRFRLAFENANVGVCLVNLEGNLIKVNQKMADIFGYTPEQMQSMNVNDLTVPEDKSLSTKVMNEAIHQHVNFATFKKRYIHSQGHIIYGEVCTSLVRDINCQPLYFISYVQDISQRIEDEKKITQSRDEIQKINQQLEERVKLRTIEVYEQQQLLQLYFDQSIIGMAIVSVDKFCCNVNQKFSEIVGYSPEELRIKTWAEITHPDDIELDLGNYQRVLDGEIDGYQIDKRYIHKNGHAVYANLGVQAHRRPDGSLNFCVVMIQDIGDRKAMENSISLALQREKELNELRSQFITSISHQFRTPLTTIACAASIMEKFQGKITREKQGQYLHSILKSVKYIDELINDITTINLNTEEVEPMVIDGDLIDFCHELIDKIEYLYAPYKINFHPDLAIDLNTECEQVIVRFDPVLLAPILNHLLTNGIKYSPTNYTIDFHLRESPQEIIFDVLDYGIGIPKTDLEKIFEPFQRGSNVGHIAGIGIGLTIARKLVTFYGGKIEIQSELGEGTRVSLSIPKWPFTNIPWDSPA
ncbi:PAS domain S-box protein [Synechocystis sp. FACHB-383]|uniref:sensor histidine kinase n=1 Tax=Synechocystis sp. FACHB-383 TaxID=2692864 RepID=UPI001686CECB|nr:PAS domain-containing sensor histidine kinase [Synechocystis sp. FACHB-383]MBD2654195.1 PAS domain S-box protein [Synechocystis sp. FACHB-383]